jgi:hypothetical protein
MLKEGKYFLLLLLAISISTCGNSYAQVNAADSQAYRPAVSAVRATYTKAIGINSYLYTGKAYERYWNRVAGHPFFQTEQFQKGTVLYNGTIYEDVPLVYDMLRDEIVSKTFTKEANMVLLGEKTDYFTIGTHRFVRIRDSSVIIPGFYEELYTGYARVLVKRENKIERSLKEENTSIFREYDYYYIEKDGVYHSIATEGDLQALFKDQKAEIRKFLNRRGTSFKKDPANTIVQTVAYYALLKK